MPSYSYWVRDLQAGWGGEKGKTPFFGSRIVVSLFHFADPHKTFLLLFLVSVELESKVESLQEEDTLNFFHKPPSPMFLLRYGYPLAVISMWIRLVCTTHNWYQARQALNIYESNVSAAPKFTGSPVSFSPALALLSTSTIFWRETVPHR